MAKNDQFRAVLAAIIMVILLMVLLPKVAHGGGNDDIVVDHNLIQVTLDRNKAEYSLVHGPGFTIRSNAPDVGGIQIRYLEPTQGVGFAIISAGMAPGTTIEIPTYINVDYPDGVYTGEALVEYLRFGSWYPGPIVEYEIRLVTGRQAAEIKPQQWLFPNSVWDISQAAGGARDNWRLVFHKTFLVGWEYDGPPTELAIPEGFIAMSVMGQIQSDKITTQHIGLWPTYPVGNSFYVFEVAKLPLTREEVARQAGGCQWCWEVVLDQYGPGWLFSAWDEDTIIGVPNDNLSLQDCETGLKISKGTMRTKFAILRVKLPSLINGIITSWGYGNACN